MRQKGWGNYYTDIIPFSDILLTDIKFTSSMHLAGASIAELRKVY